MKSCVSFAIALTFLAELRSDPAPGNQPSIEDFGRWTAKHSKAYETVEEHSRRFAVWSANHATIAAHNSEAARGLKTFRLKMNALGDLTSDEYRSKMLGLRRSRRPVALQQPPFHASGGAPDAWDWRPKGIVTPVKNQAQCGSCWSFSAVAALEGAFNLHSNGTVPSACQDSTCGPENKPCCSFSEQELVDCVNDGAQTCNTGGNPADGVDYVAKNMHGKASTETEYPYTSGGGVSKGVCLTAKQSAGVATGITGFTNVAEGDEAALKDAVYEQSIISIGIDASHQSFQFYNSGVYTEPECSSTALDHGVAIVGYGTGGSGAYWIVRNSWGANWGLDGYILMARDRDNQCGVASDAVYANVGAAEASAEIVV